MPFGSARYQSTGPNTNTTEEYFEYNPVSRSDSEVIRAMFGRYERVIQVALYPTQPFVDSNVQKAAMSGIAKPGRYSGESSIAKFDEFLFSAVNWMKAANLCGPAFITDTSGVEVVSAIDEKRTTILGSYLDGEAKAWYQQNVLNLNWTALYEDTLMSTPPFVQVVAGIYRRFIHEASFHDLQRRFDAVTYRPSGGLRQLFAEMRRWTSMMPCPPDAYRFKHRLLTAMPSIIRTELSKAGITAGSSDVNTIMQRGLTVERGLKTEAAYERDNRTAGSSKPTYTTEKKEQNAPGSATRRFKKVQGERHSTRPDISHERERARLQAARDAERKPRKTPSARPPPGACYGCGGDGHFVNNPECPRYGQRPLYPRRYETMRRMDGEDAPEGSTGNTSDHSSSDSGESHSTDSRSPSRTENVPADPWGGSQYESDGEDEIFAKMCEERIGFMGERSPSPKDEDNHAPVFPIINEDALDASDNPEYDSDDPYDDTSSIASHEEESMDFGEYLRAMQTEVDPKSSQTFYRPRVTELPKTRVPKSQARPRRSAKENRVLSAFILLNGRPAFTLFDSGSTSDAISPDFARVAGIKTFQLAQPIPLQLGTRGSRSKINFGAECNFQYGNPKCSITESKYYFDISNIDRYDLVIGTVFMRKHGISIDFEHDCIRIRGQEAPTLSEGEEHQELVRRYSKRTASEPKGKNADPVPMKSRPSNAPPPSLSAMATAGSSSQ